MSFSQMHDQNVRNRLTGAFLIFKELGDENGQASGCASE
jgi:hypothetical protein